jgi:hypothetical protein
LNTHCVFITGDLAFNATIMGRKGMTKPTVIGAKLRSSEWQHRHAPGLNGLTGAHASAALNDERTTENGESYPQLDCIELERFTSSSTCDGLSYTDF